MTLIKQSRKKMKLLWPVIIFIISVAILGSIVWIQYTVSEDYREKLLTTIGELKQTIGSNLQDEKTRQEVLKFRLENEQRAMFFQSLIGTLSASIGIIVALCGMWVAFAQYLSAKERERLDRASKDLEQLWEGIAKSENSNAQAAAIAALQHFLSPDMAEYHDRVAGALALVSRMKNRPTIVEETFKPIIEKAMRQITSNMRQISWQGARIQGPDFSDLDLSMFDFRDSKLPEANFRNCILTKARFDAANLVRTCFESASMPEACFEYADLADANFRFAKLHNANLRHIWTMNMDLFEADLDGARLTLPDTDWRLVKEWRTANFPPGVKDKLLKKYGPPVSGPRVLMLLWEFLPNVSGGLWTAVYHFLHNLRNHGANISVAVPHAGKDVSFFEFGNEIPLLPLGGKNPIISKIFTTYDNEDSSRKNQVFSGYDTYKMSLTEIADWFASIALETIEQQNLKFDVIHAHDWITFPAARAISEQLKCPWIAHFHSTERDRRPDNPNIDIEFVENEACKFADAILTPSHITQTRLSELYNVSGKRVQVVPNCLSVKDTVVRVPPLNRMAKKVVFFGRLTKQKGPDYFVDIARNVIIDMQQKVTFIVYGQGDMENALKLSSEVFVKGETIHPKPQQILPTAKNSPQRLSSPIEINDIAPADYDEILKQIRPHKKKSGEQKEELIEFILSRGFVAYSYANSEFTHFIKLEGNLPEGVRPWYCINAEGLLKSIKKDDYRIFFVQFKGAVKWLERKKFLQEASILVVPSRYEPFGMVVLEAMQQGIPVLYEDSAGVGEVINAGIKIKSAATKDVAKTIIELLNDENKWQKCAEEALREAAEYPRRAYEMKLIELWSNLTKNNNLKIAGIGPSSPLNK